MTGRGFAVGQSSRQGRRVRRIETARTGRWLDQCELPKLLAAGLAVAVAVAAYATWSGATAMRAGTGIVGSDFSVFYAAGTLAVAGRPADAYDLAAMAARALALFGPAGSALPWPYLPPMLPLVAALAVLPYPAALAVWAGGSLAGLGLAVRRLVGSPVAVLIVLASPSVLNNWIAGQGGALFAALLLGALWLPERRPAVAGLCAGLMILKPHLAALVPLAYLAGGHRRAFAFAAASTLAVAAAATAWTGFGAWGAWLDLLSSSTFGAVQGALFDARLPSVFGAVRMAGAPAGLAHAAQLAAGLAAAVVVVLAWREPGTAREDRVALVLLAGPLVSPYLWFYDLVAASVAVALVQVRGAREGFRPWEVTTLALAWGAPLFVLLFSAFGLPLPVCNLASLAAFAVLARGTLARGSRDAAPVPAAA